MKKSIAVVSILVVILSICFTACNGKNVIIDENGEKHVLVTNKDGSFVQDEYGNVFEVLTNESGENVTKSFLMPDRVTNKRGNKIENTFIKLNIPRKWSDFSTNNKLSIKHEGRCLDMNETQCQIDVSWDIMTATGIIYENYRAPVRWLVEYTAGFGDLKEYETEIFGLHAKAISYRAVDENYTFYYYLVERGLAAFEIEAAACDDCYSEDELKELVEKAYTLKDLGGSRPTASSTKASSTEPSSAE